MLCNGIVGSPGGWSWCALQWDSGITWWVELVCSIMSAELLELYNGIVGVEWCHYHGPIHRLRATMKRQNPESRPTQP